ncbi:sensor histidine kinase [Granulicoccus sp. GXG6511]|uniref:sensor histidine kinase n=1 Tax=Granulicoccus sp. GXG6511 TaxID=3381351 RepID=UPI003D7EBD9A
MNARPRLNPGLSFADRRDGWVGDIALTGLLLALAAVFPYLIGFRYLVSPIELQFLVSVLLIAPLALRSHYPQVMLLLSGLAGVAHLFVANGPLPALVVVPVVVYSVAREVDAVSSRSAVLIGLIGAVVGPMHWYLANNWEINFLVVVMLVCTGMVLTPYVIGRRLQESAKAKDAAERLEHERVQTMLAERDQRARMAEISARQQIARELHDIVAHSLSVMVVQAEGGRALAAKKPEKATEVLETIAGTGREALVEMRRIVGVLRNTPDEESTYAPMPGLGDIGEMVHRTGDRVTLRTTGHQPACGPATQLTVYRIVQEALTNFLKHAGARARGEVELDFGADRITIEVTDDGLGSAAQSDGMGNGLKGMRERVSAMGGTLEAGPRPEGGFRVCAVVPLAATGSHRWAGGVAYARERPKGHQ